MRHIKLLFIGLLLSALSVKAQNDFTKIDAWLSDNVKVMGGRAYLMIYKDGKVIYSHGESELNTRQKIVGRMMAKRQGKTFNQDDYTASTSLQIASCSKWLSASLIMTFVDEGKLKLNDTVGKYLPILSKKGKGKITIAQCLSHQTGIKALNLKDDLEAMRSYANMDDAVANIANLPMEGESGKVFRYSNIGLQIAGAVIEKVAGKNFEQLFQERIARPLAMKNTSFGQNKVVLPAGGATSSSEDYINFLVMVLNKGVYKGNRILSENSIKEMQINRITDGVKVAYSPSEAGGIGYGFGEWVSNDTVSSPGLFGSYPLVDNKNKYAAFLMTYYLKNDGKQERYVSLKKILDEAISR
ncbi:serine hydrolase domain-containing protein [Pedobacter frigiditerrae]|uniref:serine hydrolase domain-containing protein n=1 Tax=Pedobacter frigiditerrae TaxID=2530452 RepID=UPI00292E084B|nr:serine hydrolase domain-containing protein [Pedobacter frigiditerrae]